MKPHEIIPMLGAMSIEASETRTRLWTAARWWHGATAMAHLADRKLPPAPRPSSEE
jgi:hypothetical protein